MNISIKAALLSGLVFPGLGQVVLKHYKRAIILILTVSGSLSVVIVKASQQVLAILEKLLSEGGPVDIDTITKTAAQVTTASDSLMMNLLSLLILVCWIIGIVDAYVGGKEERSG